MAEKIQLLYPDSTFSTIDYSCFCFCFKSRVSKVVTLEVIQRKHKSELKDCYKRGTVPGNVGIWQ